MKLQCIVCGKVLKPAFNDDTIIQPYGGTLFHSHGHYGSTIWDPSNSNQTLQLILCDPCVVKKEKLLFKATEEQVVTDIVEPVSFTEDEKAWVTEHSENN